MVFTSDGKLHDVIGVAKLDCVHVDGKTSLHRVIEVPYQLLEIFPLGGATGYGGNLRPVATFLGLMDDYLEFHGSILSFASKRL